MSTERLARPPKLAAQAPVWASARSRALFVGALVVCLGACHDFSEVSVCETDPGAHPACGVDAGTEAQADVLDAGPDAVDAGPDGFDAGMDVLDAPRGDASDGADADACPVGSCLKIVDLVIGLQNTNCVRLSDASVRCWGRNDQGQVGDGSFFDQPRPVPIDGLQGAKTVAVGAEHACAVLTDRSVACWGRNDSGQLGDGTVDRHGVPTKIRGLTGVRSLALGSADSCALLETEEVLCWGAGNFAGDGAVTPHRSPTPVPGLNTVSELVASGDTICARKPFNQWLCWGANAKGTAANGGTSPVLAPTPIARTFASIKFGIDQGCGLSDLDGHAYCWGDGSFHQFGFVPSAGYVTTPTAAPAWDGAKALSVSASSVCAIRADDSVACAGRDELGELGDGLNVDRVTPAAVINLGPTSLLRSGINHSCALDDAGLWCWGGNSSGQLGVDSFSPTSTPTPVRW